VKQKVSWRRSRLELGCRAEGKINVLKDKGIRDFMKGTEAARGQ
jgi:hypothetical protein